MEIRIYDTDDGEHEVWLELDEQYSGLCLGGGLTRAEAIDKANIFLKGLLVELGTLAGAVDPHAAN